MEMHESGIYYQASLPLGWQKVESFPVSELARWMHANALLLRALAMLDTPLMEIDMDTGGAHGKLLERLEAKVDLTLNLLAQLLDQHIHLPPHLPVVLRAESIDWTASSAPESGNSGVLTLYLSPKLPQPLMLPVTVISVTPSDGAFRIHAKLTHMNEEMLDWLERTLFRYHRRAIHQMQAG